MRGTRFSVSLHFIDSVVWNDGKEPKVHIDEAIGNTLIPSEGVAKGGGYDHKPGVYQFAKTGSKKFFVLSAGQCR
jgi:hypothetical protein